MTNDIRTKNALPVLDCGPNRRQVLSGLGCVVVASQLSGCTIAEVFGDTEGQAVSFDVADAQFAELATVEGIATLDVGVRKVILIRRSESEVVALDRICSHAQCDMAPPLGVWQNDALLCICHQTTFNVDGTAQPGGATEDPIEAFAVDFNPGTGTGVVFVGVEAT